MSIWWWLLLPAAWFSWRYAWWRPAVSWSAPRILLYHMVREPVKGSRWNGLRVSPTAFDAQLGWLKRNGFRFFTVAELLAQPTPPARAVAITFDDGYADNLVHALPILQKHGARATLFLVCDRHRDWSANKKAHHNDGELGRERKLSDAEVKTLLDSGCIELASHTLTHVNLLNVEPAVRQQEITDSKAQLEQQYGQTITGFAYPFGLYSALDCDAVKQAGYHYATTTETGIGIDAYDRYQLPRVKISGRDSLFSFVLRIRGGRRGVRK